MEASQVGVRRWWRLLLIPVVWPLQTDLQGFLMPDWNVKEKESRDGGIGGGWLHAIRPRNQGCWWQQVSFKNSRSILYKGIWQNLERGVSLFLDSSSQERTFYFPWVEWSRAAWHGCCWKRENIFQKSQLYHTTQGWPIWRYIPSVHQKCLLRNLKLILASVFNISDRLCGKPHFCYSTDTHCPWSTRCWASRRLYCTHFLF